MIKFTNNYDWDFGMEPMSIITDSQSMVKRASAKTLLKFEKTANQTDVHVIAMGAIEGTGFNRNCFFKGTPVRTPHGFKAIDELSVGELVLTDKGRFRPVVRTIKNSCADGGVEIEASNLARPVACTQDHPVKALRAADTTRRVLYGKAPYKPGQASDRFEA